MSFILHHVLVSEHQKEHDVLQKFAPMQKVSGNT
jgi:hypothetical protein